MDALVAAAGSHRVIMENSQVRVLDVVIEPGTREPEHTHQAVSVMIVDEPARIRYYEGEELRFESPSGSPAGVRVSWMEPEGPHSVENIDERRYHAIRVELKLFGADVVVVFFYDVHGGFLGGRAAAVDADVGGDQVLLLVRVGSLVLGYETAGAGVGAVVQAQSVRVLLPRVVVIVEVFFLFFLFLVFVVAEFGFGEVQGVVRLLLGQELVQGLAFLLLLGRGAEPDPGRPPLRGHDAPVQRIVARGAVRRVGAVQDLEVFEVLGLVAGLVRHL
jgi:hypothetical protein